MFFNNNKKSHQQRDFNRFNIIAIVIIIAVMVLRLTWLEVANHQNQSVSTFSNEIKELYKDTTPKLFYQTPTLENLRAITIRKIFSYSDFIGFFDNPTRVNKVCLYIAISFLALLFYHLSSTLWLVLGFMLILISRGITIESISLSAPHFFFTGLTSIAIYFYYYSLTSGLRFFKYLSLGISLFLALMSLAFLPMVIWTALAHIQKKRIWALVSFIVVISVAIYAFIATPELNYEPILQKFIRGPRRFMDLQFMLSILVACIALWVAFYHADLPERYLFSVPFILFLSVTHWNNELVTSYALGSLKDFYPEMLYMNQTYDLICIASGIFALHYLATKLIFSPQTTKEPS